MFGFQPMVFFHKLCDDMFYDAKKHLFPRDGTLKVGSLVHLNCKKLHILRAPTPKCVSVREGLLSNTAETHQNNWTCPSELRPPAVSTCQAPAQATD